MERARKVYDDSCTYNGSEYQSGLEPSSGYHTNYDASKDIRQIDPGPNSKNKENYYGRFEYENDSIFVRQRREDNRQSVSSVEQQSLHKSIYKGEEVFLHGLHKPVPKKPIDDSEIEYFPISPHLTRIRVHKTGLQQRGKNDIRRNQSPTPAPPTRKSSKYNSALKFCSKMSSLPKPYATGKKKPSENTSKNEDTAPSLNTNKSALKLPSAITVHKQTNNDGNTSKKSGTVVKNSTTYYTSTKNPKEDKSLKVTVAISTKGKELLKASAKKQSTNNGTKKCEKKTFVSYIGSETTKGKSSPSTIVKLAKKTSAELAARKLKRTAAPSTEKPKKKKEECSITIKRVHSQPEPRQYVFEPPVKMAHVESNRPVASRIQIKSEPALNSTQVYLKHKRPVSESKFKRVIEHRYQSKPESIHSSLYDRIFGFWDCLDDKTKNVKFWQGRSSSEPPPASANEKENLRGVDHEEHDGSRSSPTATDSKTKHKLSAKSSSLLSMSHLNDHADYQTYIAELMHSTPKSERFKELKSFYATIERKGHLERTAFNYDLKPRLKGEAIIDYERWQELRKKEKAEEELNDLYQRLKNDQRQKNLLFCPNDTDQIKWSQECDRNLRAKEKSVEDLRQLFSTHRNDERKAGRELNKDIYKPLWRGWSVHDVAGSLNENRGSSRKRHPINDITNSITRPIRSSRQSKTQIGSHVWSSLSMEQLNALKMQLNQIYSTVSTLKRERIQKLLKGCEEHARQQEIQVTGDCIQKTGLHVRSNSMISKEQLYPSQTKKWLKTKSDSISSLPVLNKSREISELEKKHISKRLSREFIEHMKCGGSFYGKKRKKGDLVIPRETLGAVAAIKSKRKSPPPGGSVSPRTCYSMDISDDEANILSAEQNDYLLVLAPHKAISSGESDSHSSSASTVIHLGAKSGNSSTNRAGGGYRKKSEKNGAKCDKNENDSFYRSCSSCDLKDLFGEHSDHYKETCSPPNQSRNNSRRSVVENEPFYGSESSLGIRSRSVSPDPTKYYRAYLKLSKSGDVSRLRQKFESLQDLRTSKLQRFNQSCKRYRSDPELTRLWLSQQGSKNSKNVIKEHEYGDVKYLKDRYERKYGTRADSRSVSPIHKVPFRLEDRLMPHINVISKQADLLQLRSPSPRGRSRRDLSPTIKRLKRKFEPPTDRLSLISQLYTSSPDFRELRNISPYLECEWIAHQYPLPQPVSPSRYYSGSRSTSASPTRRQSSIPKPKFYDGFSNQRFDPSAHTPTYRYQPLRDNFHTGDHSTPNTIKFQEPVTRPYNLFHPFSDDDDATYNYNFRYGNFESSRKYVESEIPLQCKVPVRNEIEESWSEDELNRHQAETMRRMYQEERRRKYLQELQNMSNRRHADNFAPSQRSRSRTPERKLVARAVYSFTGQTSKELTFRKGDIIHVRRQIDRNWYEGEHNATIGLFPINYVEIISYDEIYTLPKRSNEGQAKAKYNFVAQSKLELSLIKGELITLLKRIDNNWYEGKIGDRRGIFPISYVNVIREPGIPDSDSSNKPIATPAAHSLITHQHRVPTQHCYQPNSYGTPVISPRNTTRISSREATLPYRENLLLDTSSEPIPYRALYNYRPQNEDELELREGDIVYVTEKCDDGWYVGSSQRTSHFGTFPGNYLERIC